ncbi:hypothetical protein M1E08_09895 [Erwinia sp. PK3-005]|uniref:DUF4222 domain-containing protein n=1 Tax=Mixta hanseatica TaxID=2872648 RepID=A0ABY4R6S1_9GAMM|nr:hypothetical protein [Mixta hanseatica]UQY42491.1 hypothetical protein K6958_11045 [Mixta hanseatica]
MAKFYYVEKLSQQTIKYQVHSEGCALLPAWGKRDFLGTFYHERDAVKVSRLRHVATAPCSECFDNPKKYRIKI